MVLTEKELSVSLGRLTRPTRVQYYTIATVQLHEQALGDPEVVKHIQNTFHVSYGTDLPAQLIRHRFYSGGIAFTGPCGFTFYKVNENALPLSGVQYSLYLSLDFTEGAHRIAYSDAQGAVTFEQLPEGIFYVRETQALYGYIPNPTVYKVVLSEAGYEIWYGDAFEYNLSTDNNTVTNQPAFTVEPVAVTLEGSKQLSGREMFSGMFTFAAKDSNGDIVATGTSTADGRIVFDEITLDKPGTYLYTLEEVAGPFSDIHYDPRHYTVQVAVTEEEPGKLSAQTTYPAEGVMFNNSTFSDTPVTVTLHATKILTGKNLTDGMFQFTVRDQSGSLVATGTQTADGRITFSPITINAVGEYRYTVAETEGGQSGITYDRTVYTVTVNVVDDGNGNLIIDPPLAYDDMVFINHYATGCKSCLCYARRTKCRRTITGKKIWIDNNNAAGTRPPYVTITLLRDGTAYQHMHVDANGNGRFIFCCVPIGKNARHRYTYQVDELEVPPGYTKKIEGCDIINMLEP